LPKTEDHPRLSTLTIATRFFPFSKTMALAKRSPLESVAGFGLPIPPETGKSGFGVIILLAAPTFNVCANVPKDKIMKRKHVILLRDVSINESYRVEYVLLMFY
jgi:hypothetical protein